MVGGLWWRVCETSRVVGMTDHHHACISSLFDIRSWVYPRTHLTPNARHVDPEPDGAPGLGLRCLGSSPLPLVYVL